MYTTTVQTQDQAVAHLFFHCCFKDGQFTEKEIKTASDLMVTIGLNKDLNLKDEVLNYRSYHQSIDNESTYLSHLVDLIKPSNELALYSYCVDLCLSDDELSTGEETLLSQIAQTLNIDEDEQRTVKKLIVQLDVVETEKYF